MANETTVVEKPKTKAQLEEEIATLKAQLAVPPTVKVTEPVITEQHGPERGDATPVPSSWEKMKAEILSSEILGIREDMSSGEIKYSLFIPKEMSTADQQHWINYKQDKRTIVVKQGELSVKQGLIKIRNNLVAGGKQSFLAQYP